MPLKEKYGTLLDNYMLTMATDYALFEELGVVDKYFDLSVKVWKNMLPSLLGAAFKAVKAIAPGRAFKRFTRKSVYALQTFLPQSNIELTWVSSREVLVKIKNCPSLKRVRDLLEKAGLDIDPRFHCEWEAKILPEVAKEVGVDVAINLQENGCTAIGTLR